MVRREIKKRKIKVEMEIKYCNCRTSQCKKGYCICFTYGVKCDPEFCSCYGCQNLEGYAALEVISTPPYHEVVESIRDLPDKESVSGSTTSSSSTTEQELLSFTDYLEIKSKE